MDHRSELAAARVGEYLNSWSSLELTSETRQWFAPNTLPTKTWFDSLQSRYIETAAGQRVEHTIYHTTDSRQIRASFYSDGAKCANVNYDREDIARQKQVYVSSHFGSERTAQMTQRPCALKYYYVGRLPLVEALAHSEFLEDTEAAGRRCESFLIRDVPWGSKKAIVVVTLDKSSPLVLRVAHFADDTARRSSRAFLEWRATAVTQFDGKPLASESVEIRYAGDRSKLEEHTERVTSARFNGAYNAETFWPQPVAGSQVVNIITGERRIVPGGERPAPKAVVGVRAEGEGHEWMVTLGTVGTIGGAICILAAVLLRWYRR